MHLCAVDHCLLGLFMAREGQTVTVTHGDANLSALVFLLHIMLKTYFKCIERLYNRTTCIVLQASLAYNLDKDFALLMQTVTISIF